jgi:deltex-like protein
MFDYPQHCHQNHHQKYFLGDNSNRGQQHVTSSTGEYRQYPPPTASATTAFPDNSMSHSYNDELQRIQREQDDLAFAKNLQQQQEEKGCDVYEEAVARIHDVPTEREQLVQMLLTVATKEAEQRRLNREQQRNVVRARVVEYVAPDEIPEKRPAFSLVPDILFEEEEGSDKKDVCAICYEALSSGTAVALTVCGHTFHLDCIDDLLEHHKSKHCPQCRKSVRQEPQGVSPSGSMSITKPTIDKVSDRYPPHTDGSSNKRVIQMDYKIPDGFQKVFHFRPGERFRGCTKVAYLPDSMEGRALLERLIYAFSHGLTFKVTKDPNNPDEKDHVDWGTVPHTTTVMDEKDDMQYLYYVACHEELDQLGVPR